MERSKWALQRWILLAFVAAAVVALGGLRPEPRVASADDVIATVKSCDANSSSSTSVDCTIVLSSSVPSGGAWTATVTDSYAMVTACDGSAAGAACATSNNAARFDCPSGCQPNSTYTITVSASLATAMQETFAMVG